MRSALDMHAAFDEEGLIGHAAAAGIAGYRPRLSIGINTGPVVTGMFASGGAWNYTAVGDTVNVAARLQGICEPGGILVGGATYQQTSHLFEFGEEQILQVKGRSELVVARPVTAVRAIRGEVRALEEGVEEPTLLVLEDLLWADRTTLDFLCSVPELALHGPFLLVLISRPPLPAERSVAGTVAAWLEAHLAGQGAEYDDWVAFHLERSNKPAAALPFLERAITNAWERGALLDAEGLIERALAVAQEREDVARLYCLAEDVATAIGNDAVRLTAIERLAALGESEDDLPIATEAAFRRARRLLDVGELDEARRIGEPALEAFRQLEDGNAEADVLRLLGRVAHLWGGYEEALDYYRAALPLEREAGDRRGEAEILRSLGLAEVDFGNFTRALDYFDQAQDIYAEIHHRPREAITLADRASAFRWLGRYEEAEETARQAEDMAIGCASRSGLIHVEVLGLTRLADLALDANDLDSADRDSKRALELLELHGDIQGPDEVVYFVRSRVLAELGRDEESTAVRERAREIIREAASWIEDEALRRSFLENVAPNPEIMAADEGR